MSKFLLIFLSAWVANICNSEAMNYDDKEHAELRAILDERIQRCAKEHGVTLRNFHRSISSGNLRQLPDGFKDCVYRKMGVISQDNVFNSERAIQESRYFLRNHKDREHFDRTARDCSRVNNHKGPRSNHELASEIFDCFSQTNELGPGVDHLRKPQQRQAENEELKGRKDHVTTRKEERLTINLRERKESTEDDDIFGF